MARKPRRNNILLPSFLFLLCCAQVQAVLRCTLCKHRVFALFCIKGWDMCITRPGQRCKTMFTKEEGKMLYIQKGCTVETDKCHYTEGSNGITMTTECCDTHDFCN